MNDICLVEVPVITYSRTARHLKYEMVSMKDASIGTILDINEVQYFFELF